MSDSGSWWENGPNEDWPSGSSRRSTSGTHNTTRATQVQPVAGHDPLRPASRARRLRGRGDAEHRPDAGTTDGRAHPSTSGQTPGGNRRAPNRHAGSGAQACTDKANHDNRRAHPDRRPVQRGAGHRCRRRRHDQSARGGRAAQAALHRHRHPGDERHGRRHDHAQNIALVSGRTVRLERDVSTTQNTAGCCATSGSAICWSTPSWCAWATPGR